MAPTRVEACVIPTDFPFSPLEVKVPEEICSRLHDRLLRADVYRFSSLPGNLPSDGVYFLFEKGESGHGGDRIVRIGSHTGVGNLGPRLQEHIRLNKDRSIFRKHIGRALLTRAKDPYFSIWDLDFTTRSTREKLGHLLDAQKQSAVEDDVSAYIEENFAVRVLGSSDSANACVLEKLCIGTVSQCGQCSPSKTWLGQYANPRISTSGLWQMQHLYKAGLSEQELEKLK